MVIVLSRFVLRVRVSCAWCRAFCRANSRRILQSNSSKDPTRPCLPPPRVRVCLHKARHTYVNTYIHTCTHMRTCICASK